MTEKQKNNTAEELAGSTDSIQAEQADPDTEQDKEQGVSAEVDIESLTTELERLKQSAADNLDKAQRAHAELENVRKRANRDVEHAHRYALETFVNELLPVLDSMELGISSTENISDINSLKEGMALTMKMFCSALEKAGVSPIIPLAGDKFDPEQHEAVSIQEQDGAEPNTVIDTMQKGYVLNGRLVRPARVIVTK